MDTYPCPNCGGVADEVEGCHRCGRAHDPVAAQLAKLRETMAELDDETRQLDAGRTALAQQKARLQAQRQALMVAVAQRLADERAGGTAKTTATTTTATTTTTRTAAAKTTAVLPRQRRTDLPPNPPPQWTGAWPPETSPRSAQNTLLTLGGVLLAIAAVVIAGVYVTTTASGGRAAVLGIATTVFLGVPVLLTRNTLTATAETIASIGLLLVLLDGYTAYQSDLAGLHAVPPALYASILFALVTGVAGAYRFATHLRAPQFAALLTVQPLLPLLAVNFHFGRDGFAAVFAIVAAFNLGAVVVFGLELRVLAAGRLRPRRSTMDIPVGPGWPRRLRELAWVMFGLTLATSVALATDGLIRARTAGEAVPAAFAMLLAAATGVASGLVQTSDRIRVYAGGAATLAVIGAVSRVDYLALPDYTLVLTAALAVAIALAAETLPVAVRSGPQLGALVGAAFAALAVIAGTVRTSVAVIHAATTPRVWAADLGRYADAVRVTTWQVPLAAVLLALFAVLVVPHEWRANAGIVGVGVVLLALPGTGLLAWWAPSLLAVAVATAATWTSLYSRLGRDALLRSGTAGVLGFYAIGTSLARSGLTAGVCAVLALTATATVLATVTWPERFGPYREQVADTAFGAAAFTLPIAVGTFAWISDSLAGVVLPMTMVTTALGVVGAAVAQVAARSPRTASAGGALAAAVGCVLFSLLLRGAEPADIAVAVLVLAAAIATASTRMFEVGDPVDDEPRNRVAYGRVGDGGVVDAVRDLPAAVSALSDSFAGRPDRPDPPRRTRRRRSPVDSSTLSAALATAALIVALARLAAVALPGIGLVTTEAMVLLAAFGVRLLPEAWRRGPRLGGVAVGGTVGLVLAGVAVIEAAHAVAAGTPFWTADLTNWSHRVASWTPYDVQVPAGLLLAAGAAWVLLAAPLGGDLGFVTLCLAMLALPATAGLGWWSPIIIAGTLAVVAGLGAAFVPPTRAGVGPAGRRLVLAFVLGGYAILVALARSGSTAAVLTTFVIAGVVVAVVARVRQVTPLVTGTALAVSLAAAPGAAATIAAANGSGAAGILSAALLVAAAGVPVGWALRRTGWALLPAAGVATASLVTAIAAVTTGPTWRDAQAWAAAAALVAAAAIAAARRESTVDSGVRRWRQRGPELAILLAVVPTAAIAAVASAPAWLAALGGPYRTLRDVWHGYGEAPAPQSAGAALLTLLLLAGAGALVALTLGGQRYVLAAVLPPLAAMAVVAPAALGAPAGSTSWVALGVGAATGLGAALSPPTLPAAAHLLRRTAGVVCAVTLGAGFAGSLATPAGTLIALAVLIIAGGTAALVGRDPNVRTVAWFVAAAAAFAFPVTALAASHGQLRTAAFYVLAICGALCAIAWQLARTPSRRTEAGVIELAAALGATLALLLTLGTPRYAAAVLTIWGLLLGAAALRRDRPPARRRWLVRAALVAELLAAWLLLYSVQVGLPEAYTLPFAAVALLVGALELRQSDELSSWLAYGPALVGGFGPSVALILIGQDPVWRWVALLAAAVVTVIVGSYRGRSAPVIIGSSVALIVALAEMIRLLVRGEVAGALLVALAGGVLVGFGALRERRRRTRREIDLGVGH